MKLLKQIIADKKLEIERQREKMPVSQLTTLPTFDRKCHSLARSIKENSGIIAEFKRKSPSHGDFQKRELKEVVDFYEKAGVSGISVLTNQTYFGGSMLDLQTARSKTNLPILQKDFIVDEYQLFQAKSAGADAILLIAAILDDYYSEHLACIAQSIGLEVLMEFHSAEEIDHYNEYVDIVGINNRNLDSLKVDVEMSKQLYVELPRNVVKISESGIGEVDQIQALSSLGYDGFLIGESLLKNPELLNDLEASLIPKLL
ncbi:MAG: indole-3-glycerol phosphate synthase TrpC [Flavobacteriales bacterium]|nr:indole-3-glycerol phosphate synthase TrpC [Flavobacteriales bacterium]